MPCSGLRHPYSLVKVYRRFGHQLFGFLHSFYWSEPGHFPFLSRLSDEAPSLQFTPITQPQPHSIRCDSEEGGNFFFPKCISISKTTRRHNRQVLNQLFNLHIIQRMENKTNIISKQVCRISVDKKNQLDVTFCILYFSGWVRETNTSMDALPTNRT